MERNIITDKEPPRLIRTIENRFFTQDNGVTFFHFTVKNLTATVYRVIIIIAVKIRQKQLKMVWIQDIILVENRYIFTFGLSKSKIEITTTLSIPLNKLNVEIFKFSKINLFSAMPDQDYFQLIIFLIH